MIIYDYSEDILLSTIIFALMTIICLVTLLFLVIHSVRAIKRNGVTSGLLVPLVAIIVVSVLLVFLSYRTFTLVKFSSACASGNYESVSGSIEIVSCKKNDYRDTELYDIEFTVNGLYFKNTNSFSLEQKTQLTTNFDKNIEVRYSYIGKELMIYQIVICDNE